MKHPDTYLGISKIKNAGIGLFSRRAYKANDRLDHLNATDVAHTHESMVGDLDLALLEHWGVIVDGVWSHPADFSRPHHNWYANHSTVPNVVYVPDLGSDLELTFAARNIAIGDELVEDYTQLSPGRPLTFSAY